MDSYDAPERQVPAVLPEVSGKPAKMLRRTTRKQYCQVITIREGQRGKGKAIDIPASAKDNRVANVIAAAKLRNLVEKQIDKYTGDDVVVSPKELLETSQALKMAADISYRAHGDVVGDKEKIPELPPVPVAPVQNNTNIGHIVIGGGHTHQSFESALDSVAKAAERAIPITVNDPGTSS